MAVKPIPDEYHSVTPYLTVSGADRFIDFLTRAFDAKELERFTDNDGRVAHAEVKIGDSIIMMAGTTDQHKPTPCGMYLYVRDTDTTYRRALQAGATSIMEPADQFYGDRNAGVKDPFGNSWWIATHIEDLTPEERAKRAAASMR